MTQEVIKCVKLNYHKLLVQSLLANMEVMASSAVQLVKSIPVLDAIIWIAHAGKQVCLQTVQRYFQKAGFSTNHFCIQDEAIYVVT
jgi:hypothetical protein